MFLFQLVDFKDVPIKISCACLAFLCRDV